MDTEETEAEAQVGSIEVSAAVLPELEAYAILLVLMLQTDNHQYKEVLELLAYYDNCWPKGRATGFVST